MARPRVTVYLNEDVYEHLEKRAEREVRTVPNLVEFLVVQAIAGDMEREKAGGESNDSK